MLKLPPGVEFEHDSVEKRYRRSVRGLLQRIRSIYNAMVDEFGDDAYDVIRRVGVEYGKDIAERIKGREENWDLQKIGMLIIRIFNNMNPEGAVTEFSDERLVIEITKCPYPMTRADVCRAHIVMEEELVERLNPELEFVLEKALPGSEDACQYVLRKKEK